MVASNSGESDIIATVIIPTFRRSERLGDAIESVLNQDFKKLEIIVVDDNEPNSVWRKHTEDRMKYYLTDDRVKYLKHSKNKNGAASRNTGIKESTGKYILFLDDDDVFLEHKISEQVSFLEKEKEFQAVYTGVIRNGKANNPKLTGNLLSELLKMETELYTPTLCLRREILDQLKGFNENFERHQDYELMARFFISGYNIGVIPKPYVTLGDNDGENIPKAVVLESVKKKFIFDFQSYINKLTVKDQKKVHIKHHIAVFIAYIKERNLRDSIRILKSSLDQSVIITIRVLFLNIKWTISHHIQTTK